MENEILIEARQLSRRYGPTVAVTGLDLTLRKGEILGLLGPNGAGKTTTMKILAGVLAPTSGEVRINGISLRDEPQAAKTHLGYLPEQPPVYPELTVDEYLDYCAGLHGIARSERAAAGASAKKDCGLSHVASRLIGNLSKGYQQRVGLAQAIIHRPPVIILDEPTVGLDPIQIREIRTLIGTLGKTHSVILSSHILPEIQAICDRVMIVHRGRVVFDDSLASVNALTTIFVTFRRPPPKAELLAIAGIAGADAMASGRFGISPAPGADPREALARAAYEKNWGLVELSVEQATLEEIFVSKTSGDEAAAEAA